MDLIHNLLLLCFFAKSSRLNYYLRKMTVAVLFEFKRVIKHSFLKYDQRNVIFSKIPVPVVILTAMNYSIVNPSLSCLS